jgi:hypothetical protein
MCLGMFIAPHGAHLPVRGYILLKGTLAGGRSSTSTNTVPAQTGRRSASRPALVGALDEVPNVYVGQIGSPDPVETEIPQPPATRQNRILQFMVRAFEGAWLKLDRAEKHRKTALKLMGRFIDHECKAVPKHNPETNRVDIVANFPRRHQSLV